MLFAALPKGSLIGVPFTEKRRGNSTMFVVVTCHRNYLAVPPTEREQYQQWNQAEFSVWEREGGGGEGGHSPESAQLWERFCSLFLLCLNGRTVMTSTARSE